MLLPLAVAAVLLMPRRDEERCQLHDSATITASQRVTADTLRSA